MIEIERIRDILPALRTPEAYRRRFLAAALRRSGIQASMLRGRPLADLERLASERHIERRQVDPLTAHINAGRWVTPCVCGAGIPLDPEWPGAACLGCGRSWATVIYPDAGTWQALDAVLAERPSRPGHEIPYPWYSWIPGESMAELRLQNMRIARLARARGRA